MPLVLIQKNTIYGNFHENLRKSFLTHFVSYVLINQDKNEDKDEKIEKMSSIFEFSISKSG